MKILDEMRDTMNKQKEDHEEEHKKFQHECADDVELYQNEVNDATVVIVDSTRRRDMEIEELKAVKAQLELLYS